MALTNGPDADAVAFGPAQPRVAASDIGERRQEQADARAAKESEQDERLDAHDAKFRALFAAMDEQAVAAGLPLPGSEAPAPVRHLRAVEDEQSA